MTALLAYAEDAAGGVMNPRYMRLRPDISVEVAIRYLRRQAIRGIEVIDYAYVLAPDMRLLGVVPFRELFAAPPDKLVVDIMHVDLVTVTEETDQEAAAHLLVVEGLLAIPVVDAAGRMKGVITADDVVDVVQEEATEDIQKIGGSEALDEPYLQIGFSDMVRKRGRWLAVLLVGEMLTATAMGFFEEEIARAVILALFVPLIISSGGNSGSQAATLVIRAMALSEVRLRGHAGGCDATDHLLHGGKAHFERDAVVTREVLVEAVIVSGAKDRASGTNERRASLPCVGRSLAPPGMTAAPETTTPAPASRNSSFPSAGSETALPAVRAALPPRS